MSANGDDFVSQTSRRLCNPAVYHVIPGLKNSMKYRGEIDGLRAMAVVPVILFHAGLPLFSGGFIGVDVFFVISGYLISTIIINELDVDNFSILRFYERRARRILPALFFVMLVCLPFAWFWLMPRDLKGFADSTVAVTFFVSNFLFWLESGYFETAAELKPLLHTWSLAVEEQYYIIFPVLLMLLKPYGKSALTYVLIALFLVSFVLSQWGIYNRPSATFFLLPARGWELLVGVFAAMYLQRNPGFSRTLQTDLLSLAGLLLIVVPVFLYDEHTPFPGAYALPATIGTGLIILFARPGTIAHRLLATRPLVAIGLVSYSAYLWHQPVFAFYKHRFGVPSFDDNVFLLIVLSLLLAAFSFWVVERPFRRAASLKQLILSMSACFVLIAGMTTAFLTVVHENYKAVPSYQWALLNAPQETLDYLRGENVRLECENRVKEIGLEYCRFGNPDKDPTIVLWGDSLAGAMLYGFDKVARETGQAGMVYITNGCPPLPGLRNTHMKTCTKTTHQEIIDRILALGSVETVMMTGNYAAVVDMENVYVDDRIVDAEHFRSLMDSAVQEFRKTGARSVLVEQGPVFDRAVAEHGLQSLRNGHSIPQVIDRADFVETLSTTRTLDQVFDTYLKTADFYCNETECPSVDQEGKMIFFDRNHLTKNYSEKLARFLFSNLGLTS